MNNDVTARRLGAYSCWPQTVHQLESRMKALGQAVFCVRISPPPVTYCVNLRKIPKPLHALVSTSFQWRIHKTHPRGLDGGLYMKKVFRTVPKPGL